MSPRKGTSFLLCTNLKSLRVSFYFSTKPPNFLWYLISVSRPEPEGTPHRLHSLLGRSIRVPLGPGSSDVHVVSDSDPVGQGRTLT